MAQINTNIIDSYIKTGRQDDKKNHIISQLIYLPRMTQISTNIIDSCIKTG